MGAGIGPGESREGSRTHPAPPCEPQSDSLSISLNYLALNPHDGTVWGADGRSDARWLLRQENRGASATYVYQFTNVIRGIHFLDDGTMFVSTDFDYVSPSPAYPCSLFRSIDAGHSFVPVMVLPTTAVVFTGFAHDHLDNLYAAEYGPRERAFRIASGGPPITARPGM
jgi:hypothetical protein